MVLYLHAASKLWIQMIDGSPRSGSAGCHYPLTGSFSRDARRPEKNAMQVKARIAQVQYV
jgi:hypothetical protein